MEQESVLSWPLLSSLPTSLLRVVASSDGGGGEEREEERGRDGEERQAAKAKANSLPDSQLRA